MVADGDAPLGVLPARDFSRRLAFGAIVGGISSAIVGLRVLFVKANLEFIGLDGFFGGRGFGLVILLAPLVVLTVLGAWFGRHAANVGAMHLLECDRRRNLTRFTTTPRRPIREITEGPVRVRGFIRALVPTFDDQGRFCVACEALADGADVATPRQARGGVFELVDCDGASTWVDARHVVVLDGMVVDGERLVPPGVVVELWATATHDSDLLEHARGYRETATGWALQGSTAHPVVLCVV